MQINYGNFLENCTDTQLVLNLPIVNSASNGNFIGLKYSHFFSDAPAPLFKNSLQAYFLLGLPPWQKSPLRLLLSYEQNGLFSTDNKIWALGLSVNFREQ